MHPITIPYVNQLAIEADIPVELAKAMLAAGVIMLGGSLGAETEKEKKAHLYAFVEVFENLGPLLGIGDRKMEEALLQALDMTMKLIMTAGQSVKSAGLPNQ